MTSHQLNRPLRTEAEALADIMVPVSLTRDELTTLMHTLEEAKSKARQDELFASRPTYPPRHPAEQRRWEVACVEKLNRVTALCDRITDIWRENR